MDLRHLMDRYVGGEGRSYGARSLGDERAAMDRERGMGLH